MDEFQVKGPYKFQPEGWPKKRIFTRELASDFREKHREVLSNAGCYVFVLKAAQGYKPWYIGKTVRAFDSEVFTTDKLQKYNESVANGQRGTPLIFLLVAPGRSGRSREQRIAQLEMYLIQTAAKKNPKLINVRGARGPHWGIQGILRTKQGSSSASSKALKKALSL